MTKQIIYSCMDEHTPSYIITYSVAGNAKSYSVCQKCSMIDCFTKHIIKKIAIISSKGTCTN